VWGERHRILLADSMEIDYLKLKANTFCSQHTHSKKINVFYVLKGKVRIDSEFGNIILYKGQSFKIIPPLKHRFVALSSAEMIEIAYVTHGKINPNDIQREKLGGKIIKKKYLSIPELRKEGYLKFNNEK
jgi:quercetin dioxygenase-like cupin family protein